MAKNEELPLFYGRADDTQSDHNCGHLQMIVYGALQIRYIDILSILQFF